MSDGQRARVPAIGPYLLLGIFAGLWWATGSLSAAVTLMALSLVLALIYDRIRGHSR